jgi:glutaredoxin
MHVVELYGKPGCHLCEEAREVLHRAQRVHGFELSEIDITADPELLRELRYDIPVVLVDGQRVFQHRVDEAELSRRLSRGDRT